MERLDRFKDEHATEENDQFWVCIDQDHWAHENHLRNLTQVLAHCRNKGYHVAMSNPCFEFWLLLHFEEPNLAASASCREVSVRLAELMGGYNKVKCCGSLPFTGARVHDAIRRARRLDDGHAVPQAPVTRMHLILEQLLARDSIELA